MFGTIHYWYNPDINGSLSFVIDDGR